MRILGVSCYFHDSAAALVEDGRLVRAAEEERFSRVKHDRSFPGRAIRFCLEESGLRGSDVDYVAFFEKPIVKFERILLNALEHAPRSRRVFHEAMASWLADKLWVSERIQRELGVPASRVLFLEHHLSHAAASFLCSPFDEAAILTVDGVGEWATAALGRGRAEPASVELFSELDYPHSLGLLYSSFTAYLGFEVNEGEYKVMGMAPYGRPTRVDDVKKVVRVSDDGSFELDLSYFDFPHDPRRSYSRRFEELFGPARDPKEEGVQPRHADIAASVQAVTEEIILKMAKELHRRTGLTKLCVGGGVAYNCVANGRLLRETPFKELYIQPAAGDSGSAVGAALYADRVLLGRPRRFGMRHAYWGRDYPMDELRRALAKGGWKAEELDDARLSERLVDVLAGGKVAALYRGAFEWGPRALGHRSILADPGIAGMKDVVNRAVKFREPFRPFAPSVCAEDASRWFDVDRPESVDPLRFMLMTVPVSAEGRERLPAVTHVDGSARPQTVFADVEPFYHGLLRSFGEAKGAPVLLNTSFNLRGEPIVASPEEALRTFAASGLDALALGPFFVSKPGGRP